MQVCQTPNSIESQQLAREHMQQKTTFISQKLANTETNKRVWTAWIFLVRAMTPNKC